MNTSANNILILGANSDIARAIAKQYASKGSNLILLLRDTERINDFVAKLLAQYDIQITVIEKDIDTVDETFDIKSIISTPFTGVVCCLGYMGDEALAKFNDIEKATIEQRNYLACKHIINSCLKILREQSNSFVIGISSVAGDRIKERNYYYGIAKRKFSEYLKTLRGESVKVIDVRLGFVYTKATEKLELPRLLTTTPEYVAIELQKFQKRNNRVIYIKWYWRYIMFVIKLIPEPIFKKLKL